MEQIFSNRKSVNPTIFDTTTNVDDLFGDASEMLEIEYLADDSTSQSQSSEYATETPTSSNRPSASRSSGYGFLADLQNFKKSPRQKNNSSCGITMLLSMQEGKLAFEKNKFEWQVEREKKELERQMEIQAKEIERDARRIENEKIEMDRQYELKKLEIEKDERLQMEKLRLEKELEEKIRMYELEMKYKIKN